MELYPIFDGNENFSPNIWYSVSGIGESPLLRVGHTSVHIRPSDNSESDKGKLYFIGGANPSNCFNDVYFLDLNTLAWDKYEDLENFENGRYEHASLLTNNKEIYIFGGASQEESYDNILKFDLDNKKCEKVECTSSIKPCARTIHVGTSYKDQLLIFGGGKNGRSPVEDQNVYIFNPIRQKWVSLTINGAKPNARHGHVMINYQDDLVFVHGGMENEKIFDDLWDLNLRSMSWNEIESKSSAKPKARAAHGGISVNKNLYIFGGISPEGFALDDLWKFDIDTSQWTEIEIFGYKPPSRLDFAYCKVQFYNKIEAQQDKKEENDNQNSTSENNAENKETAADNNKEGENKSVLSSFLAVHGGTDTEGNIFDDLFLILLN